ADRHARDQLLRASQSIPQNIAEGNGKGRKADRRRFFETARGSALECAAIQDMLVVCEVLDAQESSNGKAMLIRIVSMLTKLGGREYAVRESWVPYGDYDNDNDNDHECCRFQLIGFSVPCYPLKTRKPLLQRGALQRGAIQCPFFQWRVGFPPEFIPHLSKISRRRP
ncbi:MAG: four helix bundle protein, partial [Deltaproteobacteria bacterium]|nr:four helix bundle protein [Deltaproteobacteria bacterium]